jgi:hypothetical protein
MFCQIYLNNFWEKILKVIPNFGRKFALIQLRPPQHQSGGIKTTDHLRTVWSSLRTKGPNVATGCNVQYLLPAQIN